MDIRYVEGTPEPHAYHDLFSTTGWQDLYGADADCLARALGGSWYAVGAYEGDRLVGFGRLLSDGVLYAVIFDMIVRPERQRRGIGGRILRRLIERCDGAGIRDVLLFSARGVSGFYEAFGFARRPEDAPGMILRRKAPAAGAH